MEQEEWRRGEPDHGNRGRAREKRPGKAGEPEREHEDERRRREDGYVMNYTMSVRDEGTMREGGDREELRSGEARVVEGSGMSRR